MKKALSAVLLLFMITGCGSLSNQEYVEQYSLFDNHHLKLQIKNKGTAASTRFCTKNLLSLEQIEDGIESSDVKVEEINDGWLIGMDNGDGTKNYFYIEHLGKSEDSHNENYEDYFLSNMSAILVSSNNVGIYIILLPYQYIKNGQDIRSGSQISPGDIFEIDATISEVMAFYQESGWYDMEQMDKKIIIHGYQKQPSNQHYQFYFSEQTVFSFPIEIEFVMQNDTPCIRIFYQIFREEE